MITRGMLTPAGEFNKPHGIKGEISASFDPRVDVGALKCVVAEVNGLFVPFSSTPSARAGLTPYCSPSMASPTKTRRSCSRGSLCICSMATRLLPLTTKTMASMPKTLSGSAHLTKMAPLSENSRCRLDHRQRAFRHRPSRRQRGSRACRR